ncbi:MAG: glycosyltransferase family 2 protein [Candidatus Nanoarchaeia archaeon]|nr:glycosyltransferase family 2 protein [Candidatus Nanoarchaeia archaeon]MDD5358143.1 glycosyltransferase family 2 protein [Candidatus Nanoarchaeia archaeon]MDD5589330.1 glycosyltransferase family 2 protein [Candidatus Nanoarchaeia archaeon]
MISIIVTAFEHSNTIGECISRILNQENFSEEFELIAACPDNPTKKIIMDYKKKYPQIIKYISQDYTHSKNQLMNEIMKIAKGRILIWTDGNKFFEKDVVRLLVEQFNDEKVGIAGGRIIPLNGKNNLYDYWAHVLTNGLHKMKKRRFKKNLFIEHTATILAIRKGIINEIPLDVAEGTIISFLISNKGYKNIYVENAKVYVKYPSDLNAHFHQRVRSAKAHMTLLRYAKGSNIRYKNFYNEVLFFSFDNLFDNFLKSLSFILFLAYIQIRAYYALRIKKNPYCPVWRPKVNP